MHYDVLIVGGGVVGCALARELTKYRLAVALVEREAEVGFGTSKANSGIIHGGHHAAPSTLKGRLEWKGNQMWDALCAQLSFGFKRVGELTVALTPEQVPTLERLLQQGRTKGVPGLEIWDRARTLAAEPNLSTDVVAALHAPTTGVINPYEAVFGLAESAANNGCAMHVNCAVTGLEPTEDGWSVATTRGTFTARYVVNAAGLYSDTIAEMAGCRTFTIHPRKGEEYLLDKRLQGLVKRVIFPCPTPVSKGILVIPTYDGTIMVGPTAESVDDREDLTTSAAGAYAVFRAVQQVVPGISAGIALAARLGVSLTHRDYAQSVRFLTGHSQQGKLPSNLDWKSLVDPATTNIFYMSRHTGATIAKALRDNGMAAHTPCAVGLSIGREDELIWRGTLASLPQALDNFPTGAPFLLAIGGALASQAQVASSHQALA